MSGSKFLSPILFLFLFPSFVAAQSSLFGGPDTEAPEVAEVRVEFDGNRNVGVETVLAHVQISSGDTFEQILVDRSIRSLYQTGFFEYIEATSERTDEGMVITFTVEPKIRIRGIRFRGNEAFSDSRLTRAAEFQANRILNERAIDEAASNVRDFLRDKGYANARVSYEVERDDRDRSLGLVTFTVEEGEKIKIEQIIFEGNEAFSDGDLADEMKTSEHRFLWSWLTGSGKLDEQTLSEDLEKVRTYYRNRGYLDVEIPDSGVRYEYPEPGELHLVIEVSEGRQYRVGNINFDGNQIFPGFLLSRILTLNSGDVFSPEKLDEDTRTLRDVYGSRGYLETRVRAERIPNLDTGRIDITYHIRESERFRVESIVIEGNTKTKNVVILRELALAPGQVFDQVRMQASEARLNNTQFFENVTVDSEGTNIPGRRNLKINVAEGRTGNLTFGAGFSSLESGVIFVEFTQGNFDLFNWRSFFQGDGQKLRLLLQLGADSSEFILAFEEPWLFEQRLAFGFQIFRSETDFVSSVFNELRTGFEVYFRRRLFELVEGRLSYRLEKVDIFDVSTSSPIIRNERGERTVSKVSLTLLRDTRNSLVFTSSGNRFALTTSLAGSVLGGDTDYLLLDFRGAQFYPTFSWPVNQNLAILARAGSIFDVGSSTDTITDDTGTTFQRPNIPIFDRFFLGGPDSVRGFDFREVSPRELFGESIGGKSYAFGSLEYTWQFADKFAMAAFYDWGIVNEDSLNFDPQQYNDSIGFGIRMMVLGAPMRLDYAIPLASGSFFENEAAGIKREIDNDDGGQFWFTFGTRF